VPRQLLSAARTSASVSEPYALFPFLCLSSRWTAIDFARVFWVAQTSAPQSSQLLEAKKLNATARASEMAQLGVRTMTPDTDVADRALSATETFHFRRLETLVQTNGRFRLNFALRIALDGAGRPEVDLLCADGRMAVAPIFEAGG
jgi:hypothetical protein